MSVPTFECIREERKQFNQIDTLRLLNVPLPLEERPGREVDGGGTGFRGWEETCFRALLCRTSASHIHQLIMFGPTTTTQRRLHA